MKYVIMAIIAGAICFFINRWLGIAVTVLACAYLVYKYIPGFYASKGNKAFHAGDNDTALKWYKKAYDTGRSTILIKVSYAFIMLRAGMFEEADHIFETILAIPKLPKQKRYLAQQYRCMSKYKLGRIDEAKSDAESIFGEFKNTSMYGILGFLKILAEDPLDETYEFCREAYEYNGEDRDILDNFSIICYKLGKYDEAKKYSDMLISKEPSFIEAYYHGARIAEKCGDIEQAREYIEQTEYCRRSYMTTVSVEEIEEMKKRLENS